MSDKTVTEREAVKRERKAFVAGGDVAFKVSRNGDIFRAEWKGTEALAKERYPLPKVTRPVVMEVLGESYELRVVNGIPQFRHISAGVAWADINMFGAPRLSVNGARVLVALLANPTVEVDDAE